MFAGFLFYRKKVGKGEFMPIYNITNEAGGQRKGKNIRLNRVEQTKTSGKKTGMNNGNCEQRVWKFQ